MPATKHADPSPGALRKRLHDQRRRLELAKLQAQLEEAQAELAKLKGNPPPKGNQKINRIGVFNAPRAAMLSILDGLDTHTWHCCGDLSYDKIDGLIEKFKVKYPDLLKDADHAYRLRRKGIASHRLVVFKPKSKQIQGFFVLQSSLKDESEQWKDALNRRERITVYDYECLRLQAPQRPNDKSLAWAWKIKEDVFEMRAEQIIKDFRMGKMWVEGLIKDTKKWPGFARVRQQHKILGKYVTATWVRLKSEPAPEWPRLNYVSRRILKQKL